MAISRCTFVVNDTVCEPDATFRLQRVNSTGGGIVGALGQALVTITDDGDAGTLSFSAATYVVGEDKRSVRIEVVRVGGNSSAVSVGYSSQDGDGLGGATVTVTDGDGHNSTAAAAPATGTTDYLNVTGRLNFTDGQRSGIITVPITEDTGYEGLEAFRLHLREPGGGAVLGAASSAVVYITDTRDVAVCDTHNTRDTCSGPGPDGVCCIWVLVATDRSGECRNATSNGFSDMLCRPRIARSQPEVGGAY